MDTRLRALDWEIVPFRPEMVVARLKQHAVTEYETDNGPADYRKALVDIISMVKHAAHDREPLLTAQERVARAFDTLTAGQGRSGVRAP